MTAGPGETLPCQPRVIVQSHCPGNESSPCPSRREDAKTGEETGKRVWKLKNAGVNQAGRSVSGCSATVRHRYGFQPGLRFRPENDLQGQ